MANLAIIGSEGIVGSALKFGFELLGHKVFCHDIKLNTKLETILSNAHDACFICVPTPKSLDGSCDTTIVEKIVDDIYNIKYKNIIAIKSTVNIGTTDKLIKKYSPNGIRFSNLCFIPEFLKERSAKIDFTERHDLCIIGTYGDFIFHRIKEIHGFFPKKFIRLTPSEAEASKYFNNSLGATLVTFANSFYELCEKHNINYSNIKNAMMHRDFIPKSYLDVNDKWRSWAGSCWSKDILALDKMCDGSNINFFKYLIQENEKYIKTVPDGMRLE